MKYTHEGFGLSGRAFIRLGVFAAAASIRLNGLTLRWRLCNVSVPPGELVAARPVVTVVTVPVLVLVLVVAAINYYTA